MRTYLAVAVVVLGLICVVLYGQYLTATEIISDQQVYIELGCNGRYQGR